MSARRISIAVALSLTAHVVVVLLAPEREPKSAAPARPIELRIESRANVAPDEGDALAASRAQKETRPAKADRAVRKERAVRIEGRAGDKGDKGERGERGSIDEPGAHHAGDVARATELDLTLKLDLSTAPASEELESRSGRNYHHDDTRFEARIGTGGELTIEDKPNIEVRQRAQDDPLQAMGGLNPYIRDHGDPNPPRQDPAGPPLVISSQAIFDLSETLMKIAGEDPYRVEKKQFADDTREMRNAMCDEQRSEQLKAALNDLPAQLRKVWARADLSSEKRRRVIFELWDTCAEEGPNDVLKYSEMARDIVLDFIKNELPEGSADAYSERELFALNEHRRSRVAFTPYVRDRALPDAGTLDAGV